MAITVISDRVERTYGYSALALAILLSWYAIWTVTCTLLILVGVHYTVMLWVPVIPTAITMFIGFRYAETIVQKYSVILEKAGKKLNGTAEPINLGIVLALVIATITAELLQKFDNSIIAVAGATAIAIILYYSVPSTPSALFSLHPKFGWRVVLLLTILYSVYLFGHRPDGDDANFVNLAIGAKRTHGFVYQYDTMIGDGPNLIHLPTYKFHSFEILGAVLSTYLHISPVYIFHFVMPLLLLPFLAAILIVALGPTAGPRWFPAALLWMAFLFLNLASLGGWGLHGVVRLFQGKGFYVSGILPLIGVLTVRWFQRGERVDLIGLLLANTCAIGFSANGIYGGPATSILAGLPFVLTNPTCSVTWRRILALAPAFAWPIIVSILILVFGLAYPSEILVSKSALQEIDFVTWYGVGGRIIMALILVVGIGLIRTGLGKNISLVYIPLFFVITMNTFSWRIIEGVTGNLGFRIFWSLPAPILVSILGVSIFDWLRIRTELSQILAAGVLLVASILYVSFNNMPEQRIAWHMPTLRVKSDDWENVIKIKALVSSRCSILLPQRYAILMSMNEHAPTPVAVRDLYMVHYRFTLPEEERKTRANLLSLADGNNKTFDPNIQALRKTGVKIGAIAADKNIATARSLEKLAQSLGLIDRGMIGPLRLWASACYQPYSTVIDRSN